VLASPTKQLEADFSSLPRLFSGLEARERIQERSELLLLVFHLFSGRSHSMGFAFGRVIRETPEAMTIYEFFACFLPL
jgi:hypothetical protein